MGDYVIKYTNFVKGIRNQNQMTQVFDKVKPFYEKELKKENKESNKKKVKS